MKKVIWIIWALAAWKDYSAEIVSSLLNIPIHQISWELKQIAKDRGINDERWYLIELSRELTSIYWDWYLAEKICTRYDEDILLIAGMRQIGQIEYLKANTDLLLIWINASDEVRFNRIKGRRKAWDPFTLEEFIEVENKENKEWAQKTDECIKMADYIISNEWSSIELKDKLKTILETEKLI